VALRDFQQLLLDLRERLRRESYGDRVGRIHEVRGDKVRVVMGGTPDKPMLSPWLHTTNMRGGARERRFFRKGQTVRLSCPGGDLRQATVTHYAESDYYPAPDHADDAGEEAETYQQGATRVTKTEDTYEMWLAEQSSQQPNVSGTGIVKGVGQQQAGGQQQQKSPGSPASILRQNKDGGITGRVAKNDSRFAAHEKGAKIKAKPENWVVADPQAGEVIVHVEKQAIVNKPWVIEDKKDPVPDDNKHVSGRGKKQASGSAAGGAGQGS
jgi:hypothetical protein